MQKYVIIICKKRGGGNSYWKANTDVPRWSIGHRQGIRNKSIRPITRAYVFLINLLTEKKMSSLFWGQNIQCFFNFLCFRDFFINIYRAIGQADQCFRQNIYPQTWQHAPFYPIRRGAHLYPPFNRSYPPLAVCQLT